jgi:methionyl-tRNA formyltransferase
MSSSPRIIFMGTPEYALVTLKALFHAGIHPVGVFSQPDKPSGRGQKFQTPPCALFAKENNLPLFQPATLKNDESLQNIRNLKPDLIVVVAYGLLLPKSVLEIPTIDTINLHASLLPYYRGAAPIQWALINGDKETGVSLMQLDEQMDTGAVFAQTKIPIPDDDNEASLFDQCSRIGTKLLMDNLDKILAKEIKPAPQNNNLATFARKLQKEDGIIDFTRSAQDIFNLIRGIQVWPGAHTSIDNKRLKIYDARPLKEPVSAMPGQVYQCDTEAFYVACGDGSLAVRQVQLEGKNRSKGGEFARGYLRQLPIQLGIRS